MTSARKRRILNKRRKPVLWVFSYWYRLPGQNWQTHVQRIRSSTPPKTFRIDLPKGTSLYNATLEQALPKPYTIKQELQ